MDDSNPPSSIERPDRPAWNKGKLTGPKPPLRPGHVWLMRLERTEVPAEGECAALA